jgi:hypothetical protein
MRSAPVYCLISNLAASDLVEDLLDAACPDGRFGVMVILIGAVPSVGDQLHNAVEGSALVAAVTRLECGRLPMTSALRPLSHQYLRL